MARFRLNTFSHTHNGVPASYRLWLIAPEGEVNQAILSTIELDLPENDEIYILDRWSFIHAVDVSEPEDWEFDVTQPNGNPLPPGQELPEGINFNVGAL